jgi:hypothetical protein
VIKRIDVISMKRTVSIFLIMQIILFVVYFIRYFLFKESVETISDPMTEENWRNLVSNAIGHNNIVFAFTFLLTLIFSIYLLIKLKNPK